MAYSSRDLHRAADIYDRMLKDKECGVILTLAGSLISAGLKKVFVDMIRNNMVDAIVSTGANIVRDFSAEGITRAAEGLEGVRLSSGDPSRYSALAEQSARRDAAGNRALIATKAFAGAGDALHRQAAVLQAVRCSLALSHRFQTLRG